MASTGSRKMLNTPSNRKVILIGLTILLTGCGGGGGGSSDTSTAPVASQQPSSNTNQATENSAPTLSGETSFSIVEGQLRVIDLVATDPDGETVSLFLAGVDSEYFTISQSGRLSFISATDFEAPSDYNKDNVYQISLRVSDGTNSKSYDLTIEVLDDVSDNEFIPGSFEPSSNFSDLCAVPRSGNDPSTDEPYLDNPGEYKDENNWLRSWSNELYLWYDEIEDVDPGLYTASAEEVAEYFGLMKTFEKTSSGADKDKYHFSRGTAEWQAYSVGGVTSSYGVQWAVIKSSPPREVAVAFTEPNTPATSGDANLARGARILEVDGVDVVSDSGSDNVDKLNAAFFPSEVGETHEFVVRDLGSSETRTFSMTSAEITSTPVQNIKIIPTASGPVGYFLFNDHIATAEKGLVEAFETLNAGDVVDLVLDLRYNGGGYLAIASQVAYMIAGSSAASGRTFESLEFNDKNPTTNPVTGGNIEPTPFYSTTLGFSLDEGVDLPTLNLSRVFVLTNAGTCSASEAIMNGLRGINVDVIQIGNTTCGKPYGFYGFDNCGTTYFSIQFRGVNDKGYGDYTDGFVPVASTPVEGHQIPGCVVDDDFDHLLGDAEEARLKAALNYRTNGSQCPSSEASSIVELDALRTSNVDSFNRLGSGDRLLLPAHPGRILRPSK